MTNRFLYLIVSIFFLASFISAQELPEDKKRSQEEKKKAALEKRRTAQKDTSKTRSTETGAEFEEATADSSDLIPVESSLYWYDLEERLTEKSDTTRFMIICKRGRSIGSIGQAGKTYG